MSKFMKVYKLLWEDTFIQFANIEDASVQF